MKRTICIVGMIFALGVCAADVRWDCFVQEEAWSGVGTSIQYRGYADAGVASLIMPGLQINSSSSDNLVTLVGSYESMYMEFCGLWVQMSPGDVVDHASMTDRTSCFVASPSSSEFASLATEPISTGDFSDSIYLAVMQKIDFTSLDPDDYLPDDIKAQEGEYFGWIELTVSQDGDVTLAHSAFAVDRSAMIVGGDAVPEPAGGILLLLGTATLVLRRRRVNPVV